MYFFIAKTYRSLYLVVTVAVFCLLILPGCGKAQPLVPWLTSPEAAGNFDILFWLDIKPKPLEFLGCWPGQEQTVFEFLYQVRGRQAGEVEEFLKRKFGMSGLIFECCGWEPEVDGSGEIKEAHIYDKKDQPNYFYSITMYSDETLLSSREEWPQIEYFHVVIKVLKI